MIKGIRGAVRVASCALAVWWLAAVVQPHPRSPQSEADVASCRAEKAALKAGMAAVFADFSAAPAPIPVELLVSLDGRIRALLRSRPRYRPCESDGRVVHDRRWERMGVAPAYGDHLAYSGRLLVLAHRRAPRSPLRPYTLFSTVLGELPAEGLGVMPHINAARAYEAEFPHGPFIRDVYRTIADFHKDLFMVLRDRLNDFKYECFAPYITKSPWPAQQARAKAIAVDYYQRILRLAPADEDARQFLAEIQTGKVRGWSFCAD